MTNKSFLPYIILTIGLVLFGIGIILFMTIYSIAGNPGSFLGNIGLATLALQPGLSGFLCILGVVLCIIGVTRLIKSGGSL